MFFTVLYCKNWNIYNAELGVCIQGLKKQEEVKATSQNIIGNQDNKQSTKIDKGWLSEKKNKTSVNPSHATQLTPTDLIN